MPVPRRKTSRGRRDNRRSHHALEVKQLNKCPRCGEPRLSHRACRSCGFYRDHEVIPLKEPKQAKQ